MAKLIAENGLARALPVEVGECRLSALFPEAITSVTIQKGQKKTVSDALKKSYGFSFPTPGRGLVSKGARCIWVAPEQAFLLGKPPKSLKGTTLTDQSDGWVVMRLQGIHSEAVLARLIPLDLKATVFKSGYTARSLLFHVPVTVISNGSNSFDLMVFRSMAKTAIDELSSAMRSVTARALRDQT